MSTTTINLKIDGDVKQEAQRIAKRMGLSLSTVIKLYLSQFIRTQEIYISAHDIPEEKEKVWKKEMDEVKNDKGCEDVNTLMDKMLT